MTSYKDLGKDAKDLLGQNFLSGYALNFSGQYKAPHGVTLKTIAKRTLKKDPKTKVTFSSIELGFEPKYELSAYNIELTGKASSVREYSGILLYKDAFVKGGKVELSSTKNDRDGVVAKLDASYKKNPVAASLVASYPLSSPKKSAPSSIKVIADFVFGTSPGLLGGLMAVTDIEPAGVTVRSEATVSLVAKHHQWAMKCIYTDQSIAGNFLFLHKLSDALSWAIGYDMDVLKGSTAITVGFENKLNKDTTLKLRSTVKSSDGTGADWRVALSSKYHASTFVTFVLSSDFNIRHFTGDTAQGEGHSFGLDVKLE